MGKKQNKEMPINAAKILFKIKVAFDVIQKIKQVCCDVNFNNNVTKHLKINISNQMRM